MRVRMDRENRAKQFMPFAALKGYEEALRRKEKIVVERRELSEEKKEELDRILKQIRPQDMVTVVYFKEGEYLERTGLVARIDETAGFLKIVNLKIPFADICELRIEGDLS